MRLMRVGPPGSERPAVWVDDARDGDVGDVVHDVDAAFSAGGAMSRLKDVDATRSDAGNVEQHTGRRISAPFTRPHQIWCIGLNYRDHAAETGQPVPEEPIVFTKAPNTLIGPDDDVRIPRGSDKTDWEVELGVLVGTRASYLPDVAAAEAVIAGYVLVNDVSERAFQMERGGQWVKGKSSETFNPAGPWLS